jgi:RimJ/RimL family protein N-acetyltransferase
VWLSPDTLRRLAIASAEVKGAAVPEAWRSRHLYLVEIRLRQLSRYPEHAPWLMRAVLERESGAFVGQIGFHGAPGYNGLRETDAVELGYSVDEPYRGRGYATEAARGMIAWAARRGIRRVLASISPDNGASLAVARKLGMREVTVVVDDVDGPEVVFELRTR